METSDTANSPAPSSHQSDDKSSSPELRDEGRCDSRGDVAAGNVDARDEEKKNVSAAVNQGAPESRSESCLLPEVRSSRSDKSKQAMNGTGSHQQRLLQRLANPPERLQGLKKREFHVGAATTLNGSVAVRRREPTYDDLHDPHLAPFWARQGLLIEKLEQEKADRRKAKREARKRERDIRKKLNARHQAELETLAAAEGGSDEKTTTGSKKEPSTSQPSSHPTSLRGGGGKSTPRERASSRQGTATADAASSSPFAPPPATKGSSPKRQPVKPAGGVPPGNASIRRGRVGAGVTVPTKAVDATKKAECAPAERSEPTTTDVSSPPPESSAPKEEKEEEEKEKTVAIERKREDNRVKAAALEHCSQTVILKSYFLHWTRFRRQQKTRQRQALLLH